MEAFLSCFGFGFLSLKQMQQNIHATKISQLLPPGEQSLLMEVVSKLNYGLSATSSAYTLTRYLLSVSGWLSYYHY